MFLARFGRSVTIIHRRDTLRASKIMQDRALANDKISFLWNTVVEDIVGEQSVEALVLRDVQTDEVTTPAVQRRVRGDRPPAQHRPVQGSTGPQGQRLPRDRRRQLAHQRRGCLRRR